MLAHDYGASHIWEDYNPKLRLSDLYFNFTSMKKKGGLLFKRLWYYDYVVIN